MKPVKLLGWPVGSEGFDSSQYHRPIAYKGVEMKIALSHRSLLRYFPILAALCLALGCPASKDESKKGKEAPSAEVQAAKEKEILELFKDKDAVDLPGIFLEKGKQTKDDPEGRFVLLRMARDYAAKEQDIDRAFDAVDELAKDYEIDALEWKRDTMGKLVESIKSQDLNYDLTMESLWLIEGKEGKKPRYQNNCVELDRFDIANALLDYAETTRKKAKPGEDFKVLEERVAACKKRIQEMEKQFESVKEARTTLESKPDDKAANLTWGKYLCTIKGNWEKGLPMLEKAGDNELAPLAKKEIAKPATGDEVVKLGDEWWDLGDQEQGMARQQLKKHAVSWYKKAENTVSGLTQARIMKRIKEIREAESKD
jgi:hypothetical protein